MIGGLGIRKLSVQNTTYVMKLAFQLVSKVDTLWVRVVRAKYKIIEICPASNNRPVCSYVWRSLIKVWSSF